MKKKLSIINIDGVDGIGKTTQINMLSMFLKKMGISVLTVFIDDTTDSAIQASTDIWKFLENNPDGLVLSDGSVARMIVIDTLNGTPRPVIIEKHRAVIHEYEKLSHKYGVVNILMVTDDIEFCHKRMLKRGRIFRKPEDGIVDTQREEDIVRGMRYFDANAISKQLIFQVFDIDEKDSMMEIQDMLWDYLDNHFEIKKPS